MNIDEARETVRKALTEARSHPDVQYEVDQDGRGTSKTFRTFDEAAAFAVMRSLSDGRTWTISVLIDSLAGARAVGMEDAYQMDPEASAHEQIAIRADARGIVP